MPRSSSSAIHPRSIALGLTAALTTAARIYSGVGTAAGGGIVARAALRISEGDRTRARTRAPTWAKHRSRSRQIHRAKGDEGAAEAKLVRAVEALTNGLGRDHPLTREAVALQALPAEVKKSRVLVSGLTRAFTIYPVSESFSLPAIPSRDAHETLAHIPLRRGELRHLLRHVPVRDRLRRQPVGAEVDRFRPRSVAAASRC